MKVEITEAIDGRRLLSVTSMLRTEEADAPNVRATYELYVPEDFTIKSGTQALVLLSCVRTDTFEPVTLCQEQQREFLQEAVRLAAEDDPDW